MIRAVIFDFDGVLANSEPLHFRAFRDVLAEQGLALTEASYYDRYLGYDDLGAFRAIAADASVRLTEPQIAALALRKAEQLEVLERGASVLFPGARDAIVRMAGVGPLAIASGALRAEIAVQLPHGEARERVVLVHKDDRGPAASARRVPRAGRVRCLAGRNYPGSPARRPHHVLSGPGCG